MKTVDWITNWISIEVSSRLRFDFHLQFEFSLSRLKLEEMIWVVDAAHLLGKSPATLSFMHE